MQKKYNFNTISAGVFILLAITLFIGIPYQIDKPLIEIAGAGGSNLAAELFPQIVAASLFVLGVWYFRVSFAIDQKNQLLDLDREAITNVVVTLILMAIYVPLMVNLGFVFGSAVMIFAMSTYFGNRNFWLGGLISLFLPMAIYLIFLKVLFIELPAFPIDDVIPNNSLIYGPLKFLTNNSFF